MVASNSWPLSFFVHVPKKERTSCPRIPNPSSIYTDLFMSYACPCTNPHGPWGMLTGSPMSDSPLHYEFPRIAWIPKWTLKLLGRRKEGWDLRKHPALFTLYTLHLHLSMPSLLLLPGVYHLLALTPARPVPRSPALVRPLLLCFFCSPGKRLLPLPVGPIPPARQAPSSCVTALTNSSAFV